MKYRKILMKYNAYLKVLFSLVKTIKSDISVVENINFWMTSAFFIIWFCFTSHYARRYMSNGMKHLQRPCREFVRAFNKFSLVESWILDRWSSGSRYIVRWNAVVRWPSAVRCICCHWTMYPNNNFQPIRICLPHAQIRGMTIGHSIALHNVHLELQRQVTSLFVNKNIKCGYSFS